MVFLCSLIEKYVGKQFEIDCVDIEVHHFKDNQPPIFKGHGVIRGDKSGRLSFEMYNQIKVNKEILTYLKQIREENDPNLKEPSEWKTSMTRRLYQKAFGEIIVRSFLMTH